MAFLDETGLERLWTHLLSRLNDFVPITRTINNKALTDNIILTAEDVGADASGSANAVRSELTTHTGNTNIHITAAERTAWNAKQDAISVLSVNKGGTGYNSITDTTYTTARYRASALVTTETDPIINGVINWTYE